MLSCAAVFVFLGLTTSLAIAGSGESQTRATVGSAPQGDWIPHPPDREEFRSRDGQYRLTIATVDSSGWKSRRSTAELQQRVAGNWQTRWKTDLPHEYRPRFAAVSVRGEVILLDEWINIISRLTVVVVGPAGKIVASKGADAVLAALGLPAREVVPKAKHGWWLQAPPRVTDDGLGIEVQAADRVLLIRFSDGTIRAL